MRFWRQLENHEAMSQSSRQSSVRNALELRSVYQHTNKSENAFLLKMMNSISSKSRNEVENQNHVKVQKLFCYSLFFFMLLSVGNN